MPTVPARPTYWKDCRSWFQDEGFVAPGWLVAEQPNYLLGGIGLATIALEIWMIVEAVKLFPRVKGVIEENALDRQLA